MRVNFVVLAPGGDAGRVIPVSASPFVIGRDPACHLRPVNQAVSNRHCALTALDDRVYVSDLRSTNGTFVNGTRVGGEFELRDHDRLQVGPVAFLVRLEAGGAAGRRAPPPASMLGNPAVLAPQFDAPGGGGASAGADNSSVPTGGTVPFQEEEAGPAGAAKGERRRSPRWRAGDIRARVTIAPGTPAKAAQVLDLSRGGVRLALTGRLWPGAVGRLRLERPSRGAWSVLEIRVAYVLEQPAGGLVVGAAFSRGLTDLEVQGLT
ncbi:MAG TPA: FHA domain-containing protein [Gemmataceae bacterium]|jgi:hypothetical protein|nr:FHA domain-containing protein [Gemmataceae bacterium]